MLKEEPALEKDIHSVSTKWNGGMDFESHVNGHIIHLDKLPKHGGTDKGPRPKQLILSAIAGCTGMEIVSILNKMRIKIDALSIDVSAVLSNEQPKVYKTIQIIFQIKNGTDNLKIERAVRLAVEKYCGVVAMVRQFAELNYEIEFL